MGHLLNTATSTTTSGPSPATAWSCRSTTTSSTCTRAVASRPSVAPRRSRSSRPTVVGRSPSSCGVGTRSPRSGRIRRRRCRRPTPLTEQEHAELIAQERVESATLVSEFEVRVTCSSHHDTVELSHRLRAEGIPYVRRWRYLLIGATDEESAAALAERLSAEAPAGSTVTVEGSLAAVNAETPTNPFAVFGGLGPPPFPGSVEARSLAPDHPWKSRCLQRGQAVCPPTTRRIPPPIPLTNPNRASPLGGEDDLARRSRRAGRRIPLGPRRAAAHGRPPGARCGRRRSGPAA